MEWTLLFFFLGLAVGILGTWLVASLHFRMTARSLAERELQNDFVRREVFDALQSQADVALADLKEKEHELRSLGSALAIREQQVGHLEERLSRQKEELETLRRRMEADFENLANRLFEEKSQRFAHQNRSQLDAVLTPLKDKIKTFEDNIEKKFRDESQDLVALKTEIQGLRDLNRQLSQDANNLASALKGENKMQGDWGEFQLEMLLERAGLKKGIHFEAQASFRDENGATKRPDILVHLPGDKHLVIDSKVSLVAFEKYFNAPAADQPRHRKAHLDSLRAHIHSLHGKNYQQLYQINSPDYLLLFIPLEPAFHLAIAEDNNLFLEALERNVVLVSTSTLLATMRTVAFIWKQEKQNRSALEIARQSGFLYDKFVAFVDDLKNVGLRMDSAKSSYDEAMNKLVDAKRYGDTLVGRAEKIRELGARASKKLPKEILDLVEEESEAPTFSTT